MAQAPVINGITPQAGPIGTVITIEGQNFSASSGDNKVLFGTIPANVSASTSTSITVVVPVGATYDQISVRVNGLIAYSPKPFTVTFESNGEIDVNSFMQPVNITGIESKPINMAAGDLDGDGKVDVVTANQTGTISIFRNIYDGGDFTLGAFASPVHITVQPPFSTTSKLVVRLADIDVDGKPEILISYGSVISVLQNLSVPGTLNASSFATKVDLTAPYGTIGVAVEDLDGDGKPEIVSAEAVYASPGNVNVFRNTSVPGTISASSFAACVSYAVEGLPDNVAVGDVDGDGKVDLVAGSRDGHSFTVLRNETNGPGTFSPTSFATKKTFFGTGPIELTDLDNDNRLDVLSINEYISIHRNMVESSQLTDISFPMSGSFFASGYAPTRGAIADLDGDGFVDVVTTDTGSDRVSILENSHVPGTVSEKDHTNLYSRVQSVTDDGPTSLAVADINADGKADIITANDNSLSLSILINKNVRTTPPPVIASFTPADGTFRDVVVITGSNFSAANPGNNFVNFNGVQTPVTACTTTSLTVSIPLTATTGKISVRVNGFETAYSTNDFLVNQPPTITEFIPLKAPIGSSVVIKGSNFSSISSKNKVHFGTMRAEVIQASETELTVKVPKGTPYKPITVTVNEMMATSAKSFNVTYTGTAFSASTFGLKKTLYHGVYDPVCMVSGDIDGNGKTDMLIASRGFAGYYSIVKYRDITDFMYLSNFDYPVSDGSLNISAKAMLLEDIDVDGMPDLIVLNSTSIDYYKNLSTPGVISFGAKVTLFANQSHLGDELVLADIDLDGKRDLILEGGPGNGEMLIVKNTSIRGTVSFELIKKYTKETLDHRCPLAGDLNGDNKIDIAAIAYQYPWPWSCLAILENKTSTINNSVFDPLVTQTTSSFEGYPPSLADFDGDGKLDMVARGENKFFLLRNTTSAGNPISFGSEIHVTTNSYESPNLIHDMDGDGKPDLVTTFGYTNFTNIFSIFRNVSQAGTLGASSFERRDVIIPSSATVRDIVDLNGDGGLDVIAFDESYFYLYQNGTAIPAPRATQTITFNPIPEKTYDEAEYIELPKLTSAGLPITYTVSAQSVASVTNEWLHIKNAGTTLITATQNGNDQYEPATPVTQTLTVKQGTQFIIFDPITPVTEEEDTLYLEARSSGVHRNYLPISYTSSNTNVATVQDTVVKIKGPGSTIITASQPGNNNYEPAQNVTRELIVKALSQSISFNPLPDKIATDPEFSLSASATSSLPVTFSSSNTSVATITDNKVVLKGMGEAEITASQSGNLYYPAATPVTRRLVVKGQTQTIQFETLPTDFIKGIPVTMKATSSSGLPVEFTSSNETIAVISGNELNAISVGETDITASQAGNQFYLPSVPVIQRLKVSVITGIDDANPAQKVMLTPNPATNTIHLRSDLFNKADFIISVVDSKGGKINLPIDHHESTVALDISSLQSGLYVMNLRLIGTVIVKKFMKL